MNTTVVYINTASSQTLGEYVIDTLPRKVAAGRSAIRPVQPHGVYGLGERTNAFVAMLLLRQQNNRCAILCIDMIGLLQVLKIKHVYMTILQTPRIT